MGDGFAAQLKAIWRAGRNQTGEMNGMMNIGSVLFSQNARTRCWQHIGHFLLHRIPLACSGAVKRHPGGFYIVSDNGNRLAGRLGGGNGRFFRASAEAEQQQEQYDAFYFHTNLFRYKNRNYSNLVRFIFTKRAKTLAKPYKTNNNAKPCRRWKRAN